MPPTSPTVPPAPTPLRRLWRFVTGFVVFLIVAFHLVVLAVRNPLDLWEKPIRDWLKESGRWQEYGDTFQFADNFTYKYTNLVGCEQRWTMFSPPMWRKVLFLAYRIEFTDGSFEVLKSDLEPEPTRFFRTGSYQLRKHEDYLLYHTDDLESNPERPLWEAYARTALKKWRTAHEDDPRKVERLVLVRRRIDLPAPDQDPAKFEPATETDLAAFDAEGRLLP